MSDMFYECSSLSDITKWDTMNAIKISYMLRGCSSL